MELKVKCSVIEYLVLYYWISSIQNKYCALVIEILIYNKCEAINYIDQETDIDYKTK